MSVCFKYNLRGVNVFVELTVIFIIGVCKLPIKAQGSYDHINDMFHSDFLQRRKRFIYIGHKPRNKGFGVVWFNSYIFMIITSISDIKKTKKSLL